MITRIAFTLSATKILISYPQSQTRTPLIYEGQNTVPCRGFSWFGT